jgi:hypothetical protein
VTDFDVSVFQNRHRGTDSCEEQISSKQRDFRTIILEILIFSISVEKSFKLGGSESLPDGSGPTKSLAPRAVNSGKEHVR